MIACYWAYRPSVSALVTVLVYEEMFDDIGLTVA